MKKNKQNKINMNAKLFVLSGPSGVGKGTVLDKLMEEEIEINYSISVTTRKPRQNEVDGEDYYFISEDKYFEKLANNEFIESAKVHNNYYGTPRKKIEECINNEKSIILEIDIQGAKQLRPRYPNAIFIFLVPPSFTELENRLKKRGTEDKESKKIRMENAKDEVKETVNYDYEITNDDLEQTVKKIKDIIIKETSNREGDLDD